MVESVRRRRTGQSGGGNRGSGSKTDAGSGASLGPLENYLGYSLRRAQMQVFTNFSTLLSQFDLKPGQFGVLIVIDNNPGLRATDVCNALGFQKANFAPLVRTLEQRGLVRRRSSAVDRRTQTLQLTATGKRLLQRALKVHDLHERRIVGQLGAADCKRLVAMLRQLTLIEL